MGCLEGSVLVTGGSGTLGRAILLYARREGWPARFTVFARSESRLVQIRGSFPQVRTIIGDIRDRDAIERAIVGHDTVLHLAAMKRIPEAEENPSECIQVNVVGTENVLRACAHAGVQECVVISTDKACQAATVYGASKFLTEGLMATYAKLYPHTRFHGVRYGNVVSSTGSLLSIWEDQVKRGEPLTITSRAMRRFWMSPFDAVRLIEQSLDCESGVIAIPKMAALNIEDMIEMLYSGKGVIEIGLRSNEKISEDLVHENEPVREDKGRNLFLVNTNSIPRWGTGTSYSTRDAPDIRRDVLLRMIQDSEEVESRQYSRRIS